MGRLPEGEVTFLLTEVVGSTDLWERAPSAMTTATAELDRLVLETVERHGGVLVKPRGEGDSHFLVFAEPVAAVAAAAELITASDELPLKAAVHTGPVELRDGAYYGPPVNRCARMRGIAHPGQILVSGSSAMLLGGRLPVPLTLRDIGLHYLRDLARPENIFQLCGPGLEDAFPPLASAPRPGHGLPVPLTSFIGRDQEVEALVERIGRGGVISITGLPGVGKSRVALEALAQFLQDDPQARDRVAFVDDADHLVDMPNAEVVIATSRAAKAGADVVHIEPLATRDAMRLFADRARAAKPGVALDDDKVERICAQLDGLPLAIELAAARLSVLSIDRLLARLDDPARLLTSSTRRVPAHHQSMAEAVQWAPVDAPVGSLVARVAASF